MKALLLFTLSFLAICVPLRAGTAEARSYATQILEATNAKEALRTTFVAVLDPMLDRMHQQGVPQKALDELRIAFDSWFAEEMDWADLRPKIEDLYLARFNEVELSELLFFFRSPAGQKAIQFMPQITQQSAKLEQEYIQKKQASLQRRLQPVFEKYRTH